MKQIASHSTTTAEQMTPRLAILYELCFLLNLIPSVAPRRIFLRPARCVLRVFRHSNVSQYFLIR